MRTAFAALLVFASFSAQAQSLVTIKSLGIGCRSQEAIGQIARISADRDWPALAKRIEEDERNGECVQWQPSQRAFVNGLAAGGTLACLRAEGAATCFWTPSNFYATER